MLQPRSLASMTATPWKVARAGSGSVRRSLAAIAAETLSGSFGARFADTLDGNSEYCVGPSIARTAGPATW